jgi:hypothetical protein
LNNRFVGSLPNNYLNFEDFISTNITFPNISKDASFPFTKTKIKILCEKYFSENFSMSKFNTTLVEPAVQLE